MNVFLRLKNLLFKDKMIFGAGIMSAGIFIGSIFNYLTQIFLGRFLSIEDYGTFNSLLSFTVILAIPSTALLSSMIKTVAGLRAKNDFKTLTNIFWSTSRVVVLFGLGLSALVLLFREQIFAYLNISEMSLIFPFAFYIIFLLLNTMPRAYLQGLLRYKAFSFQTTFGPFLRLALSMILVIAGYKVAGAFFGLTLATLFNFFVGLFLLKKNFRAGDGDNLKKYYKRLISFGFAVLMIRISLTAISNVDLILVKHFFNPLDAGIYAGTVTIGKIILFGTGILGVVMFPIISDLYANGEDYFRKFLFFLAAQFLLVVGGVLIFFFFPKFITVNMFGKAYLPAVGYLPRFALYAGLFSMVNFIYQYLLAIEQTRSYLIIALGVLAQFILINLFHTTLDQIIYINIFIITGVLLGSGFYFRKPAEI